MESKPNEIDLIKRLEKELTRSRVREEALMSLLKTKTEGSSTIESKEHVARADPKRSTDWLIVDETSPTTTSASNSLPASDRPQAVMTRPISVVPMMN